MRPLVAAVLAPLLAACSVVGVRSGTEQPPYEVVRTLSADAEIRTYGPRLAAETTVPAGPDARNQAFRRLAGYIFGGNRDRAEIAMTAPIATAPEPVAGDRGTEIAMTAPVASGIDDGELRMQFFLPAALRPETAPVPDDPNVTLLEVPGESLAVLRFSGVPSDDRVAAKTADLLALLDALDVSTTGTPSAFFYDPPWTLPAQRRNEVVVPVLEGASGAAP